jgi:hypothetical protein
MKYPGYQLIEEYRVISKPSRQVDAEIQLPGVLGQFQPHELYQAVKKFKSFPGINVFENDLFRFLCQDMADFILIYAIEKADIKNYIEGIGCYCIRVLGNPNKPFEMKTIIHFCASVIQKLFPSPGLT